jgi:DNA-binding PucR family transcriptional regulator
VLRTYLRHERRAAETATELHMHRNNVAYRVGRIEELLGIDLNDWRVRQNLMTSFLMLGGE